MSEFKPLSKDQWKRFAAEHPDLDHYVTVIDRPGNLILAGAVEYYHFPPLTPTTRNFHVNIVEWQNKARNVFSVPKERHGDVVETAKDLAMSIKSGPPAMLFFGRSAMLFSPPPRASEAKVKAMLGHSLPPQLLNEFRGLVRFPGNPNTLHAVENDPSRLTRPLDPKEHPEIHEREMRAHETLALGIRPSMEDLASYVYGKNRVIPAPR